MGYIIFTVVILVATVGVAAFLRGPLRILAVGSGLVFWIILTLFSSYVIVENGEVGVEKHFGRTVPSAYGPDLHFIAPWAKMTTYVALRREFPITGAVITADNNPLTVNVAFATILNPALAWRMQVTAGEQYFETLVKTAAQTAVRDGIAGFPWSKAATSDRGEVQLAIQKNFERIVIEQLEAAGMTKEEARNALSFSPVQLRAATPDAKVLNAVAERSAALEDLERQKTLTQIAEQEAKRRKNEGQGVTNLFNELPKGFTSAEIAEVLGALATKTRADAMLKAVENNHVTSIIFNGDVGSGVAAAIPPAMGATKAPNPGASN